MRLIDADALFAVVKGHHDLYNGATNPTDKARRDENLQVMCDITDAPTIDAIPVEWLEDKMFNSTKEVSVAAWRVLNEWHPHDVQAWQKEQEAR